MTPLPISFYSVDFAWDLSNASKNTMKTHNYTLDRRLHYYLFWAFDDLWRK